MKYLRKNRFNTIQVVGLLTVAFLGVVTVGYAIQIPHDFRTKTGQVISANEVMENFEEFNIAVESNVGAIASNGGNIDANAAAIAAIDTTLPRMAASIDNQSETTFCSGIPPNPYEPCGMVTINTVEMADLADGYIIISGSCYIGNDSTSEVTYFLIPWMENISAPGSGPVQIANPFAAAFHSAANTVGAAEKFTLSYTVAVQIDAGTYKISQEIGPSVDTHRFAYESNNLTVQYYPLAQGSIAPQP